MFETLKAKVIEEAKVSVQNDFDRVLKNDSLTSKYDNDLLTDTRKKQLEAGSITREQAIEIMQKKVEKKIAKKVAEIEDEFKAVENAPDFNGGKLETEWKRSSTWGANPTSTFDDGFKFYQGSSIGGCGYDKASASTAEVMNRSLALKKVLYTLKEQNIGKSNHELFGYGSGYGTLPYFEGGVGVSCWRQIFDSIGFKFETVASGKMYDVYRISKKD